MQLTDLQAEGITGLITFDGEGLLVAWNSSGRARSRTPVRVGISDVVDVEVVPATVGLMGSFSVWFRTADVRGTGLASCVSMLFRPEKSSQFEQLAAVLQQAVPADQSGSIDVGSARHTESRKRALSAWGALAVLLALTLVLMLRAQSGDSWLSGDDWAMLVDRALLSPSSWFRPHNGHISVVPAVLYQLLYRTVGLQLFWPYRLLPILAHLAVVVLAWALSRRLGLGSWYSLLVAVPLAFAAAAHNVVEPFQVGLIASVAFGLGMMLTSALTGPTSRRDALPACLGLLAVVSSYQGLILVILVGAVLGVRRSWPTAALVCGPALMTYVAWRIAVRPPYIRTVFSGRGMLSWVVDGLAGALAALSDFSVGAGLVGFAAVFGLWSRRRSGRARFLAGNGVWVPALLVAAIVNYAVLSTQHWYLAARSSHLDTYRYFSVVCLAPVVAVGLFELRRLRTWVPWLVSVPLVVGVIPNVQALGRDQFPDFGYLRTVILNAPFHPLATQVANDVPLDANVAIADGLTIGFLNQARLDGRLPAPAPMDESVESELNIRLSLSRRELPEDRTPDCTTTESTVVLDLNRGDVIGIPRSIRIRQLRDGNPIGSWVVYSVDWLTAAQHMVVEVPEISIELSPLDDGEMTYCR